MQVRSQLSFIKTSSVTLRFFLRFKISMSRADGRVRSDPTMKLS